MGNNRDNNKSKEKAVLTGKKGTGVVKFFDNTKKYGFISMEGEKKDIFFHDSGVDFDDIAQNDKVAFDIAEGKKGFVAVNIAYVE